MLKYIDNYTLIILVLPLLAGLVIWPLSEKLAKISALVASLIIFGVSIYLMAIPCTCSQYQHFLTIHADWIKSLGIQFYITTDGISKVVILLTTFLVPVIILSTWTTKFKNASVLYSLIMLMQFGLIGVFVARDAFLFYVFWEITLIPIYFICALWGAENRIQVTLKFFLYTFFGSLFMLGAIIYLYLQTPTHSFSLRAFEMLELTGCEQTWLFLAFFLAFAIKMPIFPFHTWQPDTYTTSPTVGTMLLSGIMLKMGVYGVIRWVLPVLPDAVHQYGHTAMVLAIIGIIYASVIALQQQDMKRLVAYSSIAHVGLIAAGLFAGNVEGLQGAMIQMFSHGVNVVGLFFVIEIIYQRTNTRDIASLGGLVNQAPVLATFFVIIMMASVALPLTNGFPGEFLLLTGIFKYNAYMAAVAGLSVIIGAFYMLRMYQRVMLGETKPALAAIEDVNFTEFLTLSIVVIAIIVVGVYPQAILRLSSHEMTELANSFKFSSISLK